MLSHLKTATIGASVLLAAAISTLGPRPGDADAPHAFPVGDVRLKIVDATFVSRLTGSNLLFEETEPNKYRGLVLTLEVTKPADKELTLWAPDLTLHYRHGGTSDVAVCYGLSGYSTRQDVDRQMTFYRLGYGKSTTGLATTRARTVYVDVFFQYIESDISEMHLFMGQPMGVSATTTGWRQSEI